MILKPLDRLLKLIEGLLKPLKELIMTLEGTLKPHEGGVSPH